MKMAIHRLRTLKTVAKAIKRLARGAAAPVLPLLPEAVANRLSFLGRASVPGPGSMRFRFLTHGPAGKDRIALKLSRRGYLGYEQETVRVFLPLLEKCRVFLDVGANTGMFAIFAAALAPQRRVVAFEPIPSIFEMLEANIRLNRLANLTAERLAVSDREGELVFYVSRTNGGIPTDSSALAGFRKTVDEIHVPALTVDRYVKTHDLGKVDLLKIDAEGCEPAVLQGAAQTVARDRPSIICEVLDSADCSALQRLLDPLSYRYFHLLPGEMRRQERIVGSDARNARNYLFLPEERVREALESCRSFAQAA
jgi:FkbM family methyltransferase